MKRIRLKTSFYLKSRDIIMIIVIIILILTFYIFLEFNKIVTPKIIEVANIKIDNITHLIIHKSFESNVLQNELINNILIINKNKNDEIIGMDFNMENIYKLATSVSTSFNENFGYAQTGQLDKIGISDSDIYKKNSDYILALPTGIASSNVFIANLGPKIPVKIKFLGTTLAEVKTKVKDYGINNALIEVYLDIIVEREIITPVVFEVRKVPYTLLIASTIVNGKIPNFLVGGYTAKTNDLNIPIT